MCRDQCAPDYVLWHDGLSRSRDDSGAIYIYISAKNVPVKTWKCQNENPLTQGSGHDQTLDIWSVGILLYEMMVVNSESRSTMKSDYKKLSMLRIKPPGNSEVGRPPFQSTNHTMLIDRSMQLLQLRSPNQACSTLSVVSRTLYAP